MCDPFGPKGAGPLHGINADAMTFLFIYYFLVNWFRII